MPGFSDRKVSLPGHKKPGSQRTPAKFSNCPAWDSHRIIQPALFRHNKAKAAARRYL